MADTSSNAGETIAWEGLAAALAASESWLLSDPLQFAEFELRGRPPSIAETPVVELDFLDRPKKNGARRIEVYPDIYSATFLEAMAVRLRRGQPSSLPLPQIHGTGSYDDWRDTILHWVKSRIGAGRRVVLADVRDYFPSIRRELLQAALERTALSAAEQVQCVELLDALNAAPDLAHQTRSGLPIVPLDFIWMLSDLVMAEVDDELRQAPAGIEHVRWVDDFFIATQDAQGEVIDRLEAALRPRGFELNRAKLRIFDGPAGFEAAFQTGPHEAIDALFQTRGPVPDGALAPLFAVVDQHPTEGTRLLKRLYGLAARLHAPVPLDRLTLDLARFPTTEVAILNYLAVMNWPGSTIQLGSDSLRRPTTQYRLVAALRALLVTPEPHAAFQAETLRLVTEWPEEAHPFARALALGYLLKHAPAAQFAALVDPAMERIPGLSSALSRRVAYEFLWAGCATAASRLESLIAADPSLVVRGLMDIVQAPANAAPPRRLQAALRTVRGSRASWGSLDRRIAARLLPARFFDFDR